MFAAFLRAFAQVYTTPAYLALPLIILLVAGALASLIAAVLGFARASAFGSSTRWFAMAFVCILLYHIHWVVASLVLLRDQDVGFGIFGFINLFVVIASICAIIGFLRLTRTR